MFTYQAPADPLEHAKDRLTQPEEIKAQGGGSDDGNEPENETTSCDDGQGTSDTQISLLQDSSDGSLKQDDTTSTADESDRSLGKDINKVVKKFNKSHLEQPFTSKGEKRPWSKQGQSDVFEREVSKTMKSINLALMKRKAETTMKIPCSV